MGLMDRMMGVLGYEPKIDEIVSAPTIPAYKKAKAAVAEVRQEIASEMKIVGEHMPRAVMLYEKEDYAGAELEFATVGNAKDRLKSLRHEEKVYMTVERNFKDSHTKTGSKRSEYKQAIVEELARIAEEKRRLGEDDHSITDALRDLESAAGIESYVNKSGTLESTVGQREMKAYAAKRSAQTQAKTARRTQQEKDLAEALDQVGQGAAPS